MDIAKNQFLHNTGRRFSVEILDHGHALTGTDWQADVINPPYSRLYFILGGDGYFTSKGKSDFLKQGYCYLLPRGYSFSHGCKCAVEQIFFHLSLTADTGYDLLNGIEHPLVFPFEHADGIALIESINGQTPNSILVINSIIHTYLWNLLDSENFNLLAREYSPCVSLALSQIHKCQSIDLSLDDLAQSCFVSQTTLSKKFKSELNTTVSAYIDDVIFSKAQLLLKNSTLSIGEISDELGFCDQFYFSRRFRQRYKESPVNYKKRALI